MTPRFDIVAGSRTKVSDLESGYHNVLAMKIINIYRFLVIQITIYKGEFNARNENYKRRKYKLS